jgi:hypothetical protein
MRMLVCGILAVALLAVAAPASAQSSGPAAYGKAKKKHRALRPNQGHRATRSDWENPYYEHLADKLPIGSGRWFEQMEREGRFGNRGP